MQQKKIDREFDSKKITKIYEIDHTKTLEALRRNYNVLGFILGDIPTVDRRIKRPFVILAQLFSIFKFPVYLLFLVTIQTSPFACILLLISIELLNMTLNIYQIAVYYQSLWIWVKTTGKIIQNLALCTYFGICFYLATIDGDTSDGVPVPLTIQRTLMFLILFLVILEIILAFLGIGLVVLNLVRSISSSKTGARLTLHGTYLRYRIHSPFAKEIFQSKIDTSEQNLRSTEKELRIEPLQSKSNALPSIGNKLPLGNNQISSKLD